MQTTASERLFFFFFPFLCPPSFSYSEWQVSMEEGSVGARVTQGLKMVVVAVVRWCSFSSFFFFFLSAAGFESGERFLTFLLAVPSRFMAERWLDLLRLVVFSLGLLGRGVRHRRDYLWRPRRTIPRLFPPPPFFSSSLTVRHETFKKLAEACRCRPRLFVIGLVGRN